MDQRWEVQTHHCHDRRSQSQCSYMFILSHCRESLRRLASLISERQAVVYTTIFKSTICRTQKPSSISITLRNDRNPSTPWQRSSTPIVSSKSVPKPSISSICETKSLADVISLFRAAAGRQGIALTALYTKYRHAGAYSWDSPGPSCRSSWHLFLCSLYKSKMFQIV